ncbi:helix-turn-helix domain-containing protein [Hoeflea sp.]|uniref:helix-turn-helix domain-containing protein n=1 Tax=Hoeflea sp. TaxID=1940281 RepID=UPI0037498BD5
MARMPVQTERPSNIAAPRIESSAEQMERPDSKEPVIPPKRGSDPRIRAEQGDRLRAARERKFSSASEAARELRVPIPTYSAHESGLRGIKSGMADYYARMLDITSAWLISGTGSINDPNESDGLIQKSDLLSNPLMADLYDLENALGIAWDSNYRHYVNASESGDSVSLPRFENSTNYLPLIQFSGDPGQLSFAPALAKLGSNARLEGAFYIAGIVSRRCVHSNSTRKLFAFQSNQIDKYFKNPAGEEFAVFEQGKDALESGKRSAVLVAAAGKAIIVFVEQDYAGNHSYFDPDGKPIPSEHSGSFEVLAVARS